MEESCRVLRLYQPGGPSWGLHQLDTVAVGSNDTTQWTNFSVEFSVQSRCENCVVYVQVGHTTWTSYWGSEVYISGMAIERLAVDVPERT